jgi:hypothetical protein
MATESSQAKASANQQPVSLWAAALNQLKEWDPAWAEHTVKVTSNPQVDGILSISVHVASRHPQSMKMGSRRIILNASCAG